MDLQLLYDIQPYANAYGHTMSNLIYHYKVFCACNEISNGAYEKESEYFERVLRSFLITKNTSYSRSLVSKDMNFTEKDCKKITYKWEEYKAKFSIYESIDKNPIRKSERLIRVENYQYADPDASYIPYLFKLEQSKIKTIRSATKIDGITCIISAGQYNYVDDFKVSFWRNNTGWTMPLYDANSAFPEMKSIEWDEY